MHQVTRRKILVVPYTFFSDSGEKLSDPHFLMVQDKKSLEWGFISGGVKNHETPSLAAYREMKEETSGIMCPDNIMPNFSFVSSFRPPEQLAVDKKRREQVKSIIYVFVLPFSDLALGNFKPNKEVVKIRVDKYTEFNNVWSFCDDVFFKYHAEIESCFT